MLCRKEQHKALTLLTRSAPPANGIRSRYLANLTHAGDRTLEKKSPDSGTTASTLHGGIGNTVGRRAMRVDAHLRGCYRGNAHCSDQCSPARFAGSLRTRYSIHICHVANVPPRPSRLKIVAADVSFVVLCCVAVVWSREYILIQRGALL